MKLKTSQSLEQVLERVRQSMLLDDPAVEVTVHSRDVDGDTPLHKVAIWGDRQAIITLVEAGADVNAKGDMDCTPLYFAVMRNHVQAAEQLLQLGAKQDIMSELGYTPKSLAQHEGNKEMVALFRTTYFPDQRRR